jgi:CheY-like chemotaxis protein
VVHFTARTFIGCALFLALLTSARGDDSRDYLLEPETAPEYWSRVKFEIEVGKFDFAGKYLKGFLAELAKLKAEDANKVLIEIERKDGMSSFLRLLQIPDLVGDLEEKRAVLLKDKKAKAAALNKVKKDRQAFRTDVKKLLVLVRTAVKKELSDPVRIRKFIKNLSASREERAYAINELQRSGVEVVPYLIQELQLTEGKIAHGKVYSAMVKLDDFVVPPLLAALDMNDNILRRDIIDLMKDRAAIEAVPDLWYLSASTKVPAELRDRAKKTIAYLKNTLPNKLPAARAVLTKQATDYHLHRTKIAPPRGVLVPEFDPDKPKQPKKWFVWQFDAKKKQLVAPKLTASQAEEYYGLRDARHALDLDPAYKPAQVIFLSLALDKAYGGDIHLPLGAKAPAVKELLVTVHPDLVADVLDRALKEHRLPVILGAIEALGDLGDVRAGRLSQRGGPVLARALNYADRRVQIAAVDAMVRIPGDPAPSSARRIVQILRRTLLGDTVPKVLVAYVNEDRANGIRKIVMEAGFEPVVVRSRRAALKRLKDAADIDAILIDYKFPSWEREFPFVLAELRADVYIGLLPVIVTAPEDRVLKVRRLIWRYRNVWVEPERILLQVSNLKTMLQTRIKEAMGRPLSDAEREVFAERAIDWLNLMARGELSGYDVRPAEDAVYKVARSGKVKLSGLAIEILGRLSRAEAQRELAAIVLDTTKDPKLRHAAAFYLSRHIQQNMLVLEKMQIKRIGELYAGTKDPKLKEQLALVIGSMRPGRTATGNRLKEYRPLPPKEEEKPKEKEPEKGKNEKEKDKEKEE